MSFKIASRFQEAAQTINGIPIEKFPVILNRIIQKLHLKSRFFSKDEEEQLKESLGFSDADLKVTLDCCSYTYEQAAFSSTGPEPLYEILLEAGFDEQHAKALGRTWAAEAGEFINRLKQTQGMGAPSSSSLVHTDYHMNMVLGQSALSKQQEPTALFEFTINPGESNTSNNTAATTSATAAAVGTGGGVMKAASEEKLLVEFSHEELFGFFTQLERMQKQLDALGSST